MGTSIVIAQDPAVQQASLLGTGDGQQQQKPGQASASDFETLMGSLLGTGLPEEQVTDKTAALDPASAAIDPLLTLSLAQAMNSPVALPTAPDAQDTQSSSRFLGVQPIDENPAHGPDASLMTSVEPSFTGLRSADSGAAPSNLSADSNTEKGRFPEISTQSSGAEKGDSASRDVKQHLPGSLFTAAPSAEDPVVPGPVFTAAPSVEDPMVTEPLFTAAPIDEASMASMQDANPSAMFMRDKYASEAMDSTTMTSSPLQQSAMLHVPPMHAGNGQANAAAETHASASTVPVDPAEPFDHTVSIIRDGNRLAVKLEPDGLGKLDIDLRLDRGVVSAQIQVADDAAKSLLERNARQIVDALMQEGISVGGFSVSLRQGSAWEGPAGNEQADTSFRRPVAAGMQAIQTVSVYEGRVSLFA